MRDEIYFVTNRTIEQRFWLRPDEDLNRAVGKWLAKSMHVFGVEVFAFVFMSNHFHLLVRARGRNLPAFMSYLKCNLTKEVNWLRGRRGPLWDGRYSCAPVLDDEAAEERLVYTLANPVQANLVGRARLWPGMSSALESFGAEPRSFEWLDRTKWRQAGQPLDHRRFIEHHRLEITPLPAWAGRACRWQCARAESLVAERERECEVRRRREEASLMGRERVRKVRPMSTPRRPKWSAQPHCHASSPDLCAGFEAMWVEYDAEYRVAAKRLRKRPLVLARAIFPPGSIPPQLPSQWALAG